MLSLMEAMEEDDENDHDDDMEWIGCAQRTIFLMIRSTYEINSKSS